MALDAATPDAELLRRLAEVRLDRPVVLSLYLDLDPREFATPPARATAVRSILDEAERTVREREDLAHDDRTQLQASVQRARDMLGNDLDGFNSTGLALFLCEPEGLAE